MTKTTLIIADNQPLTSYALKTWAEKNELVDSVIESQDKQDLEDLLDKLSQEEVMLIMDVGLFDFSDKDELIDFFQRHLSIRKLFIGDQFKEDELAFFAEDMQSNIILKSVELEELKIAIIYTLKGRYYIQSELLNVLMRKNSTPVKSTFEDIHLTPTEKYIVTLIAGGETTKEVPSIRSQIGRAHV